MAMNFPSNPSVGDTFVPAGSPYQYEWDGSAWNLAGGGSDPVPDEAPNDGNTYARQVVAAVGGWSRAPGSNPETGVGQRVNNIIALTQAQYNALTRDPNTLYFII